MLDDISSQSLADFKKHLDQTIADLPEKGAQALTVDGQVCAVLVSMELFDQLIADREAELQELAEELLQADKDIEAGKGVTAKEAFGLMREELEARRAAPREQHA